MNNPFENFNILKGKSWIHFQITKFKNFLSLPKTTVVFLPCFVSPDSFTRICLAIELGFGNISSLEFDFFGTNRRRLRATRFWLAFRILAAFGTQQHRPEKEVGEKQNQHKAKS